MFPLTLFLLSFLFSICPLPVWSIIIEPYANANKCVSAASKTNGAAVTIQDCNGSSSQAWTRVANTITVFGNMCLDVTNGNNVDGQKMQIWTCGPANNANQQWTVSSAGMVQWSGHTRCLDLTNGLTTDGNPIQIWDCTTGNHNQVWNFVTPSVTSSTTTATTSTSSPTQTPPAGSLPIELSVNTNKCISAASDTNGASVTIQDCNGSAAQAWTRVANTITVFGNMCLDVNEGNNVDGQKMQIWTCGPANNANQQWTVSTAGMIQWSGHTRCLDLTGGVTTDGNPIQIWDCTTGNQNQIWDFGSTTTTSTTPAAPPPLALAKIYTGCIEPNTVALTFDDGPYIYSEEVSNFFKSRNIKCTFFINGDNWSCVYNPDNVAALQLAYADGHQIGDHTWHHWDLTTLTWDQINNEMWMVELAMRNILGVAPAFMRPPYGNYNNDILQISLIRNQSVVLWDFDSGDSTGSTAAQSDAMYEQTATEHPSNLLALNHETYESTVDIVMPYAYSVLAAQGYNFVTVAECLGMQPYQWIGTPGTPDATWTC